MKPVTETIARFVTETTCQDLPPEVVEAAKGCVLDWLGSAYAGSQQPPTKILIDLVHGLGGAPEATLIPTSKRTSCLNAALVNAASSHVVEMDDLAKASIFHPAAPIIPAALAAAERCHAHGREFIRAVVLGYEASMRIGEAVNPSHYHYWHTTGTVGTFGAAVAAGVILKLDAGKMVAALGSAGTQASGLWEFLADGAMSKQLHPAKAAMNGLLAALLAEKGFTAATRILEGEKGFIKATAPEFNLDHIVKGLSRGMPHYRIQDVSFKVHASCRHTHPAIDATLALVKEHDIRPEDIESVKVSVYTGAMDLLGNVQVTTPFSAKFNMPFCLATAIEHRDVGLDRFTDDVLVNRDTRALMARVTMSVDPALDGQYPQKWAQSVEIKTRSSKVVQRRVDFPRGDPENPLTQEELQAKFVALTTPFLRRTAVAACFERIAGLEQLADMNDFFPLSR